MFVVVNVNLKFAGLHFAAAPKSYRPTLACNDCDVVFESCSFTGMQPAQVGCVGAASRDIVLNRCIVRVSEGILCSGPGVQLQIDQSAFVGAGVVHGLGRDANHRAVIRQSTFFESDFLYCGASQQSLPAPLELRVGRCVFVGCSKFLICQGNALTLSKTPAEALENFRKCFREFDITDNIASFRPGYLGGVPDMNLFADLSPTDPTAWVTRPFPVALPRRQQIRLSGRLAQLQTALDQKQRIEQDALLAQYARTLPQDLEPIPEGLWAQHMQRGIRYGCDPALLPVPPPATLEPYEIPPQPDAKKKQ
jgi:hypothetical protein